MRSLSRRHLGKLSLAALVPLVAFPRNSKAQYVETAIAIIGFAIQVYSLFARGKKSGNINALTFAAIVEVSKQVAALNEKLNIVLADLDEIKKRLQTMPREIVIALRQDEILSAATRFQEETRKYELERVRDGDARAADAVRQDVINHVIEPIKRSRSSLLNYAEADLTPFMARALLIENLASALIGSNKSGRKAALEAYAAWFGVMLNPRNPRSYGQQIWAINQEVRKLDPANLRISDSCVIENSLTPRFM